uniref:Retrovirus-related Pol polyprotein from transposon TNT 1-94-like beta-barrel domain-containing protein n=1 Tax=Opuntia streptacantha TaxID=393608 RepID=A0A7C9D4H2_OPUST
MSGKLFNTSAHVGQGNIWWVLDTGASHYMTSNLKSLTSVYELSEPIYITVPDGRTVLVKKAGIVIITPSLLLRNVLYISTFTCNLNSIQQLTRDEQCTITYGATHCLI